MTNPNDNAGSWINRYKDTTTSKPNVTTDPVLHFNPASAVFTPSTGSGNEKHHSNLDIIPLGED